MPFVVGALSAFAEWLGGILAVYLVANFAMRFKDTILGWISEITTIAANSASSAVGLPNVATNFALMPPEMLSIMKRIHLDTALAIIVTAVGVRAVAGMFQGVRAFRRGTHTDGI